MQLNAYVKVLIVDDQAHARADLTRLCGRNNDIQVIGEAACGIAAIEAAGRLQPDVLLVDVELPDMSGFDVLRAVATDTRPLGIMVTKCVDQAARAFAEGAVDYLVAPVTGERFDQVIARVCQRLESSIITQGRVMPTPTNVPQSMPPPFRFLVGERQRRLYPLEPKSIDYIEADGNYVTLRVGKIEYLSRDSIKRLSTQLEPLGFIRIDRSILVNAAAISYAEVAGHGAFALTLSGGVCLNSSPAYRDCILRVIPLPGLSKRYRGTVG